MSHRSQETNIRELDCSAECVIYPKVDEIKYQAYKKGDCGTGNSEKYKPVKRCSAR